MPGAARSILPPSSRHYYDKIFLLYLMKQDNLMTYHSPCPVLLENNDNGKLNHKHAMPRVVASRSALAFLPGCDLPCSEIMSF